MKILSFTANGQENKIVVDECPTFSFSYEGGKIESATLTLAGKTVDATQQIAIHPEVALQPYTTYEVVLWAKDETGEDCKTLVFQTGKMGTGFEAQWITDGDYVFTEQRVSPKPMTFRKQFTFAKEVQSAQVYATAIGMYELYLNGQKVGNEYFAPGFTTYKSQLQYQVYDVTADLQENSEFTAVVAGGWAVGSFIFTRKNRITADRQAFLMELRVTYKDGTSQVFGTDASWYVSMDGAFQMADIYDGETYDARITADSMRWHNAAVEKPSIQPQLLANYGEPVLRQEKFIPISCNEVGDELIFDFGQNFAGVVSLEIDGEEGQTVIIRHAEILNADGTLNTAFLRTAKCTATYICKQGKQTYTPSLTYMGFRYAAVKGAKKEQFTLTAYALYSNVKRVGTFTCSNEQLNKLNEAITWGAKSNFVDIPTDCPQRDERMGWTGDIAVFAPVACYNFDMSRFLEKWLKDMRAEQRKTGGIPNTIPAQGYGFPTTMPTILPVEFWGDACILVPWAEYMARGDIEILRKMYPTMKKYVNACKFWANIWGVGKYRYIWHTPAMLHFGDWITPDVPNMSQWQGRSKWTATASLRNTSFMLSQIALLLGYEKDAQKYDKLSRKVAKAYVDVFTDGNGKMKEEFQTAYVLPLHYHMFDFKTEKKAAQNLADLVKSRDYKIGTGFPGTPYILFALADHGQAETAFKMLLNDACPSWLYEIKVGATTIWERWDGLNEEGICPIGDDGTGGMISYNHYASGAVADFIYRRIAGIEATDAGYKRFQIAPLMGGNITSAKGELLSPYGKIVSDWKVEGDCFTLQAVVPCGTTALIILPNGDEYTATAGTHTYTCQLS